MGRRPNLDAAPEDTSVQKSPIGGQRQSTKRSVWSRFGDATEGAVDATGRFATRTTDITKVGTDHGMNVISNLGGIVGTIAGGTVRLFSKAAQGYKRARHGSRNISA